jgi:DNA-binding transcriptional LysR family regulator
MPVIIVHTVIMREINLRGVDLNLLMILRALLRAQSVTEAAKQLNMSQPAVSHALARLRHLFEDTLLVRIGYQMVLTARAEAIAGDIDRILNDISVLIERPEFDPANATGRITICATEGAIGTILDALLEARERAPQVVFELSSDILGAPDRLKAGHLDLYMDSYPPVQDSGFVSVTVIRNQMRCVAARDSLPAGAIGRSEYVDRGHVVVTGGAEDHIARHLEKMGVSRRIAIITPGYLSAARIVSRSRLIMTLPIALAESACRLLALDAVELPVEIPEVSLSLSWHKRRSEDALHRWLRELLIEGARQMMASSL